mmetsp:Transcript_11245/g.43359  ORF Transcript_11245/g.43359 Transcript_11245/m.43359 type:complete len:204 (-) Transcript_11245:879-1490(-)
MASSSRPPPTRTTRPSWPRSPQGWRFAAASSRLSWGSCDSASWRSCSPGRSCPGTSPAQPSPLSRRSSETFLASPYPPTSRTGSFTSASLTSSPTLRPPRSPPPSSAWGASSSWWASSTSPPAACGGPSAAAPAGPSRPPGSPFSCSSSSPPSASQSGWASRSRTTKASPSWAPSPPASRRPPFPSRTAKHSSASCRSRWCSQ